eukprot:11387602-Ditylum_brightwellii.AAC.1
MSYQAPNLPNCPPPGTLTAVEREEVKKIYLKVKGEYDDHNTMQNVLKAHLQEAVVGAYIRQLKNKYARYLGMDMDQPIDVFFTKIDDSMQYAADGKTPYTAQQI